MFRKQDGLYLTFLLCLFHVLCHFASVFDVSLPVELTVGFGKTQIVAQWVN